jgi:2-haloacid dehalogenase
MPFADHIPAPSIAAVVFDLGGVLIDWNPRYLYRTLFDDEVAMEDFLTTVTTPEWNQAQDAGRPWSEAVDELAARHPERRELIEAYWRRWPEMLGHAIAPTVEVLDDLRAAGVRLYALSNWSAETFPLARPRYPFLDWFDGIVISGEERLIKPDPRIFALLLERYGLAADQTVFIDDHAANVEAALAAGIIGVRFEGAESLRRDLRSLGLPILDASGREAPAAGRRGPRAEADADAALAAAILRGVRALPRCAVGSSTRVRRSVHAAPAPAGGDHRSPGERRRLQPGRAAGRAASEPGEPHPGADRDPERAAG